MKSLSFHHLTPFILLIACASSAPPVGRVEARGDLYAERESPELARAEYIRALEQEPNNERLRSKLASTQNALLDERTRDIKAAIANGEPIVAAYTLSKARREFGADHVKIIEMEAQVTAGLKSSLRVAETNAQHERAFTLHAAMLAYVPESSQANRQEQRRLRDVWVAQLRDRALDDESQRLHASAALHWYKIFKLSRDPASKERAQAQRALAVAPHIYSVSLLNNAQAEVDQRLVLPHLEAVLPHPGIVLLADGSAAAGATFTITLRDLSCDERQEMRAPNKVASKRAVIIQRCVTTFGTALIPTDAYREELSMEQLLTEEIVHANTTLDDDERARYATKLADALHAQGAQLIAGLLLQDFRNSRDRIVERARALPLERAVMDAQITLFWLEPGHYGTRDLLDEVESKSGFKDAGELMRNEP